MGADNQAEMVIERMEREEMLRGQLAKAREAMKPFVDHYAPQIRAIVVMSVKADDLARLNEVYQELEKERLA